MHLTSLLCVRAFSQSHCPILHQNVPRIGAITTCIPHPFHFSTTRKTNKTNRLRRYQAAPLINCHAFFIAAFATVEQTSSHMTPSCCCQTHLFALTPDLERNNKQKRNREFGTFPSSLKSRALGLVVEPILGLLLHHSRRPLGGCIGFNICSKHPKMLRK